MYRGGNMFSSDWKPGQKRLDSFYKTGPRLLETPDGFQRPDNAIYARYSGKILWYSKSSKYGEIKVVRSSWPTRLAVDEIVSFKDEFCRIDLDRAGVHLISNYTVTFEILIEKSSGRKFANDIEFEGGYQLVIRVSPTALVSVEEIEQNPVEIQKVEESFRVVAMSDDDDIYSGYVD